MMGQQESVNESMDGNYTWTLFFWQGKQNIVQKGNGKVQDGKLEMNKENQIQRITCSR